MTKTTNGLDDFDREFNAGINQYEEKHGKPGRRSFLTTILGFGVAASIGAFVYHAKMSSDALELERKRLRIEKGIEQSFVDDTYKVDARDILPERENVPLVRVELTDKVSRKGILYVYPDRHSINYANSPGEFYKVSPSPEAIKAFSDAFGKPSDLAEKVRKIIEANK